MTYVLVLLTTQFFSLPALQKSLQRKLQRLPEKQSLPIVEEKSPKSSCFSGECKQAIQVRKRAQREYFKNPYPSNFISFKNAEAKCNFIIKQAKTSSWRNYVSKINSHTSIKSVWKKIRKIPRVHLKKSTNLISDPK